MIYEYRRYEIAPGRMPDIHVRFRDHVRPAFARSGIEPVGFFTNEVNGGEGVLFYIAAFDSFEHREAAWAAFQEDEPWRKHKRESEGDDPWVLQMSHELMKPTDYSRLS